MAVSWNQLFKWIVLICIFNLVSSGDVKRVKDRIYVKLPVSNACFRIMNGTHQFGCQSNQKGSNGILQVIESEKDIDYVNQDPGGHAPFMIGWDWKRFGDRSWLNRLNKDKVSGMLVFRSDDETVPFSFSDDSECPNEGSGLYGSCTSKWNNDAQGYRFMDFKFPIFFIHDGNQTRTLKEECYDKINNRSKVGNPPTYPLCAVELTMFNVAAGSSERCMRRNQLMNGLDRTSRNCAPLNGHNLYGTLPSINKSEPIADNRVLMLAARMDSFSMFADYHPGAASAHGNVIAMLAIMESLGRNKDFIAKSSAATGKYLMPALFNGESMDYIGSSRMVYDMEKNKFHSGMISLNNLAMILELNQLTSPANGYVFHADPDSMKQSSSAKATITNAVNSLRNTTGVFNETEPGNTPLPPASTQRFLMANRSIPALVITDHDENFQNRHYNSFSDVPWLIKDQEKVTANMANLTNAVVKFLLEWVATKEGRTNMEGSLPPDWKVNESSIQRWMDCFWSWPKFTCNEFDRLLTLNPPLKDLVSSESFMRTYIAQIYIDNKGEPDYYWNTPWLFFIEYSMYYFLGDAQPMIDSKCAAFPNQTEMINTYAPMVNIRDLDDNSSYCYVSSGFRSLAKSPAFEIEDYDMKSGKYSTWTESQWLDTTLRIYLRADPKWEIGVFFVGLLVLLLSFIVVHIISSGSDILFRTAEVIAL